MPRRFGALEGRRDRNTAKSPAGQANPLGARANTLWTFRERSHDYCSRSILRIGQPSPGGRMGSRLLADRYWETFGDCGGEVRGRNLAIGGVRNWGPRHSRGFGCRSGEVPACVRQKGLWERHLASGWSDRRGRMGCEEGRERKKTGGHRRIGDRVAPETSCTPVSFGCLRRCSFSGPRSILGGSRLGRLGFALGGGLSHRQGRHGALSGLLPRLLGVYRSGAFLGLF